MQEIIPHTKKERVANYGDTVKVTGQGRATAFNMQKSVGSDFSVLAQVESFSIPEVAMGTGDFRPFAHIEWGHGAAMAKADVDITWRQRIALFGSTVQVQVYIASFPFPGQPTAPKVPDGAQLKARVFASEGIDAARLFPTQWQTQIGQATGVLSTASARLSALRAFNPAAAQGEASSLFLLLFDQTTPPAAGDIPMDGMPLPFNSPVFGGLAELEPLGETRAFVNGISWGVSTTPFLFTPSPTPIFLSFEIQQ